MSAHEGLDAGVLDPPPHPLPVHPLGLQVPPEGPQRPLVTVELVRRLVILEVLIVLVDT